MKVVNEIEDFLLNKAQVWEPLQAVDNKISIGFSAYFRFISRCVLNQIKNCKEDELAQPDILDAVLTYVEDEFVFAANVDAEIPLGEDSLNLSEAGVRLISIIKAVVAEDKRPKGPLGSKKNPKVKV